MTEWKKCESKRKEKTFQREENATKSRVTLSQLAAVGAKTPIKQFGISLDLLISVEKISLRPSVARYQLSKGVNFWANSGACDKRVQ